MKTSLIFLFVVFTFFVACSSSNPQTVNNNQEQEAVMSSTILKIISTNPSYKPEQFQQDNAKNFLLKFYKKEKIDFFISDSIEFVDQGANFDSVACNLCGQNIEIEEWAEAMDKAFVNGQFSDLTFTTSCCNKNTSLNDLTYHSPAGFAKFVMNVSDPQKQLDESDLNELQQILGTSLRVIWAHY